MMRTGDAAVPLLQQGMALVARFGGGYLLLAFVSFTLTWMLVGGSDGKDPAATELVSAMQASTPPTPRGLQGGVPASAAATGFEAERVAVSSTGEQGEPAVPYVPVAARHEVYAPPPGAPPLSQAAIAAMNAHLPDGATPPQEPLPFLSEP